jgi:hypothetical protein
MTTPEPTNENELKGAIDDLLRAIRHERDAWEGGLATLRSWLEGPMRSAALEMVGTAARRERLEFQWKLQELVEAYAPPPPPPKPVAAEPAPASAEPEFPAKENEQPWPKAEEPKPAPAGAIRPEDLSLIAEDPRGFALAEHRPTGDWYFVTGQDQATGELQMRKLSTEEKRTLQAQLGVL